DAVVLQGNGLLVPPADLQFGLDEFLEDGQAQRVAGGRQVDGEVGGAVGAPVIFQLVSRLFQALPVLGFHDGSPGRWLWVSCAYEVDCRANRPDAASALRRSARPRFLLRFLSSAGQATHTRVPRQVSSHPINARRSTPPTMTPTDATSHGKVLSCFLA